jgi:hypothetical protein
LEVHHHSHTARKKWTHYFWEFLMLFLAVFAGFLAENQREHFIEHKRAEVLAGNLYDELLMDSINMSNRLKNRIEKERQAAYFLSYVSDSSLERLDKRFMPSFFSAFIVANAVYFEPNDGVLSQLRNSGELRYFRNQELQSAIGKLNVSINNVRSRNDREYSFLEGYLRPFSLKYYDFDWHNQVIENGAVPTSGITDSTYPKPAGRIQDLEKFSRTEAKGLISYHLLMLRATRTSYYMDYANENHRVLDLLRKEFGMQRE